MTQTSEFFVFIFIVVFGVSCGLKSNCNDGECNITIEESNNDTESTLPEIIGTFTAKPLAKPESLSMIADDEQMSFRPTPQPSTSHEEAKARSINFTQMDDPTYLNELTKNVSKKVDLSDVSMDDEEEDEMEEEMLSPRIIAHHSLNTSNDSCISGGVTYANGETVLEDCDSVCKCSDGKMNCVDRCVTPFVKRGRKIEDPLCTEHPVDDICCATLTCSDTATEALEICSYNNKTFNRGETIKNDCESICYCGPGGKVSCKPRCPPTKKVNEKCVEIPHPEDKCCKTVVCDVNDEDHDMRNEEEPLQHKIVSASYINATTIKINFYQPNAIRPLIDLSNDKKNWTTYALLPDDYLYGIDKIFHYIRIENDGDVIEIQNAPNASDNLISENHCVYKGHKYKFDQEFNDSCESLCVCRDTGVKCFKLDCPTYSGTDILDPLCVQWETVPTNFTPVPPKCCPDKVRCKSHGECEYEDKMYDNWEEIPHNITGCEKKCFCEMGKIECQQVCAPVVATPPNSLPCLPHQAILAHPPGEECCLDWICQNGALAGFPPGYFSTFHNPHQQPDEVIIHTLEPLDSHTVKLIFDIPRIIVGLYGRVEVRYTSKEDDDPDSWELQVFAPPHDLLATPQLEFQLTELRADTEYKIQVTVTLRDMHNTHSSKIYSVRTPKETKSSTLPPMIPIEPDLNVAEVNSTWAKIQWRPFTPNEMEFIDGVQLRYKELDGKIYEATPLIHRAVTEYALENLKYKTTYEVGIFFIPFHDQKTELHADRLIKFTTTDLVDTYAFDVSLEITLVKATSVEISWKGVPYPEDKYVNIYRAIYQSDSGKGDYSTFKVAKRDAPSKSMITDLKPGTRYRLWLEVYLTNGKIKTSNVQDFITKPGSAPILGASKHDKLSGDISEDRGDYYGPLVVVAILATVAILSTLVLLLILIKRHSQNKASITQPARVSQSAYDNPTYKVEIQQETMNL